MVMILSLIMSDSEMDGRWDYESSWFEAPCGALSFDDNSVEIKIVPSEIKLSGQNTFIQRYKICSACG